jgi:hypothetical protein
MQNMRSRLLTFAHCFKIRRRDSRHVSHAILISSQSCLFEPKLRVLLLRFVFRRRICPHLRTYRVATSPRKRTGVDPTFVTTRNESNNYEPSRNLPRIFKSLRVEHAEGGFSFFLSRRRC